MTAGTKRQGYVSLLVFVLPAFSFYALFVLIPALGGIWYGFTDWNGLSRNPAFVGLDNYRMAIFEDKAFLNSVLFTLKYVLAMVVLQNTLALGLALLIESRRRKVRSALRTVFFMPNMISMVIAGFMWLFIFTKVLSGMADLTGLAFLDQSWIGDPQLSYIAILIVSLWAGVGYLMIIYIAALQGIPQQLIEAAQIDGAENYALLRHIKLPMILPAITIGIFLAINSSFKVFEVVYSLTGGGPGRATQVIALNIFQEAFTMRFRFGYASAKANLLFLIVSLITLIQLRVMKKREVEA